MKFWSPFPFHFFTIFPTSEKALPYNIFKQHNFPSQSLSTLHSSNLNGCFICHFARHTLSLKKI